MKQLLFICVLIWSTATLKSQSFNMCAGTTSSNATSGNIYDSGGPTGYYGVNQACTFLIGTNCPGIITLSFNMFDTEAGYDILKIYDGTSISAPLIGSFSGGTLPNNVQASSGNMLLKWTSDATTGGPGFSASWSFNGTGCTPVADFSFITNACQGKVTINDLSTNNPTSYLWNFGDGKASTLQSPAHTYTAPGTYSITLIVSNSVGNSTLTKTVSVNPIKFNIGYTGVAMAKSAITFTTDHSSGSVYTWDFGDGNQAGNATVVHTYTAIGNFIASLTIAEATCVTTSTLQVKISDGLGVNTNAMNYQLEISPNPFSGASKINVEVAEPGTSKIEIYDQLGSVVIASTEEWAVAGEHEIKIEGLPPGIYYLHFRHNNRSTVHKLVSLD